MEFCQLHAYDARARAIIVLVWVGPSGGVGGCEESSVAGTGKVVGETGVGVVPRPVELQSLGLVLGVGVGTVGCEAHIEGANAYGAPTIVPPLPGVVAPEEALQDVGEDDGVEGLADLLVAGEAFWGEEVHGLKDAINNRVREVVWVGIVDGDPHLVDRRALVSLSFFNLPLLLSSSEDTSSSRHVRPIVAKVGALYIGVHGLLVKG